MTADKAYGNLRITGSVVGNVARVAGGNGPATAGALMQVLIVSGQDNYSYGYIPIFTSQTVYLKTDNSSNTARFRLQGWVEDATRWP